MADRTPYQEAREQRRPYANLKIDTRTRDGNEGSCLHLWGPVTDEQAERIEELIAEIARSKA